jgi:hypothetical protein
MAEQYRVILLGGSESVAPADIRASIARLFRLPEEKVEQLLCRAPVVVNRALGAEAARKLAQALEGCGARVRLEEVAAEAAPEPGGPAAPRSDRLMTCPSCGQNQPEVDTCIFCGKVVAKVQEALRRRQGEAADTGPERRRKPRPLPEINLRPMGVGEMLGEAFNMLRERLAVFAGITVLVPAALGLLVIGSLGGAAYLYIRNSGLGLESIALAAVSRQEMPVSPGLIVALFLVVWALIMFIMLWEQASLTHAVSERHLGHEIGVLSSYRFALGRMGSLSWTGFTTMLVVGLLFVGLMIPGVILGPLGAVAAAVAAVCFAARYALVEKVVILEGLSGGEARARSRQLVSGNALRLVAVALAFGLTALLVKVCLSVFSPMLESLPLPLRLMGEVAVGVLSGTFGSAFPSMGLCLFYYDARLRSDGSLTYEDLARNLG